jgi:hypothetical protein
MNWFAKSLLASAALCVATLLPVRAEIDASLQEEKTGLAYASHDKTIWNGRETLVCPRQMKDACFRSVDAPA